MVGTAKRETIKKIGANAYIWALLILMYLPVLALVVFSFTSSTNLGTWSGFSLTFTFDSSMTRKSCGPWATP